MGGSEQSDVEENAMEGKEAGKEIWLGPQVGEIVKVRLNPTVEGMVLARTIVLGRGWSRILVPPYRWGGVMTQPEVVLMEPTALPRTRRTADVKLPFAEAIAEDIRKGNVDAFWMADIFKKLSTRAALLPPPNPPTQTSNTTTREGGGSSSSSSASGPHQEERMTEIPTIEIEEAVIEPATEKRAQRRRKLAEKGKKKKKQRQTSTSSSSESSDSSDSESSEDDKSEDVRRRRKAKYLFKCRFRKEDNRNRQKVEWKLEGDVERRKWYRRAVEEIYTEAHTMELFAERVIQKAMNAGGFRPFVMEVSWLRHTAKQVDKLLLDSLHGPWALWNEPILDDLISLILELCVRVSANREYPMMFSDALRKWMKKRRVGANEQIGPVAPIWQHATFSDLGLVPERQGRYNEGNRFNSQRGQGGGFRSKYPNQQGQSTFRRDDVRRQQESSAGGEQGAQGRQRGGTQGQ